MNRYDIVFMGHLSASIIIRFDGSHYTEWGGPAVFSAMAASCLAKRLAAVTRIAEGEEQFLEPLRSAGIDLYLQPGQTAQHRVVFPNANVDEREVFLIRRGGYFSMDDMPPIEPCMIHLSGLSDHEFPLEFLQTLKRRGFHLSVDMQSFLWQVDDQTGLVRLADNPEKHEILPMVDFLKLDVSEAKALTGSGVIEEQAEMLEDWGSPETVITRSDGVLVRSKGKSMFANFTNRGIQGRMGRGDTVCGAYLARRLDHSVQDSLMFAVALTSLKMESTGPFMGSLKDVVERMGD